MFTGIIEQMGTILSVERGSGAVVMAIGADGDLSGAKIGDSICVSGACLTVTEIQGGRFSVDVSPETVSRTTFARVQAGTLVNLERALRLSDRLDGHLVSGHIDGTGRIRGMKQEGNSIIVTFEADGALMRYIVEKGSVAVDGISLTVNRCEGMRFSTAVIPHTVKITTIGVKRIGDTVNIETDMIGKYIERFVSGAGGRMEGRSDIDMAFLSKTGFL